MIRNRNFRYTITAVYILVGIALTVHAELFQAPPDLDSAVAANNSATDPASLYRASILAEALTAYDEELTAERGDPVALGIAAFTLARETGDPRWSNAAIEQLKTALDNQDAAFLRAYLGSSHALFARDYPYKGMWQAFLGPGLARIHSVFKAKTELNGAVDQALSDPVVLLLRASTFADLPWIFGGSEQAIKDFAKLRAMITTPPSEYEGILSNPKFQARILYADALRLEKTGETAMARQAWTELLWRASTTPEAKVAEWKLK